MNSEKSMIKRNGVAIRNLLIAVTLVSLIYFVYLYHDIQSRLRHSEIIGEKFKRDRESLSSQLNEINLEKSNIKEKYYKDRQELSAKYSEAQQQHKMLQSQHQDLENEYNRLQQKYEKSSEDNRQKDINRNQEYKQLKQEKELEIVKLKDENANIIREYKQLKLELDELKKQVEQQQQEAFQAWNYASQLKKTVDHLQKNVGAGAGGNGAGARVGGIGSDIGGVGAGGGGAAGGVAPNNNINLLGHHVNSNNLNVGMDKPNGLEDKVNLNNAEQFHQQRGNLHLPDVVPNEPVGLQHEQNFQLQPAQAANGDLDHAKDDEVNNLALQKQEIFNRQNEGANDHNQVQPPMNDKIDNDDVNQSEEDKEILNMLSNRRHGSNKLHADHNLNEGNQPLERVNVEDNLAGRELPNDHHRVIENREPPDFFKGDLNNENKHEKDNGFEHEFQLDGREVQDGRLAKSIE